MREEAPKHEESAAKAPTKQEPRREPESGRARFYVPDADNPLICRGTD
jgi:hypothetical protein